MRILMAVTKSEVTGERENVVYVASSLSTCWELGAAGVNELISKAEVISMDWKGGWDADVIVVVWYGG